MIKKVEKHVDVLPIIEATMPPEVYANACECMGPNAGYDVHRILYGWYPDGLVKPQGCCGVYYTPSQVWISWTGVMPEHQGCGIGQQLLDRVLYEARIPYCVYVETYEHPAFFKAMGFYLKNGFRMCGMCLEGAPTGDTVLYFKKHICTV